MYGARLTNTIFRKIIEDIEVLAMQYGHMELHENEESRSHFLAGVRQPIISPFKDLMVVMLYSFLIESWLSFLAY